MGDFTGGSLRALLMAQSSRLARRIILLPFKQNCGFVVSMSMKFNQLLAMGVLGLLTLAGGNLLADDWPRWLGATGDNEAMTNRGFNPDLKQWHVEWQTNVGAGYSSVVEAKGRAATLGSDGHSNETVFCFDATNGTLRWKQTYSADPIAGSGMSGPISTPAFTEGGLVTVSRDGQIFCWSPETGSNIWKTNLIKILGVDLPKRGVGASPAVLANSVILNAGKMAAIDVYAGIVLWVSKESYAPSFTTPATFEEPRRNKAYVASLDAGGLSILDGSSGRELARHSFKSNYDITAISPMVMARGAGIFISGSGGAELLNFDGTNLNARWSSKEHRNFQNNSVMAPAAGGIIGIDGPQDDPKSRLACIDLRTGNLVWARDTFGFGNTIGLGTSLLALNQSGELVMGQPTREQFGEVSRMKLLGSKCWTTPTYANGRIYLRNDQGDVICLVGP